MCRLVTGHKATALQEVRSDVDYEPKHVVAFYFAQDCLGFDLFSDFSALPALPTISQVIFKSRCTASYTSGESTSSFSQ